MNNVVSILNERIAARHLLAHPFYQDWSRGSLSVEDLRFYAAQYFAHVRAFPACLSLMHARCEDLDSRRVIARNLADEEGMPPTHPELWLDFAAGLGVSPEAMMHSPALPGLAALVETFRSVAGMETGLAAAGLYCYEKQIPAISAAKIDGLRKHYGISAASALRYFSVHETADVEHAAEWEKLIAREQPGGDAAVQVADRVLNALWGALDDIRERCGMRVI